MDPVRAVTLLRPGRHNRFRSFGPSFFTKFLYFAGGGAPEHRYLIPDRVVATALRDHCGWTAPCSPAGPGPPDAPPTNWSSPSSPAITCGCRAAWSACRTPPPAAPTRRA
ncbi:hypothetical protein AB0C38_28895 [Amycolatopsis sp. NPDC048633]|uniref:8-oxoguanine DNA glycosylase OGG fold protein n=1 Tax=Amycolatopsis sp. NPDC048633 TaxID=3157095 RepID=UPI0033FA4BD7